MINGFALVALAGLFLAAPAASAELRWGAVRVMPSPLETTLRFSVAESPTLQQLIADVNRSDLIVHVTNASAHSSRRTAGMLQFITTVTGHRYLRVTIDERQPPPVQGAMFAHELQHALEVAKTPWVTDSATLARLYGEIGAASWVCLDVDCYETVDAQTVEHRVLGELRAAMTTSRVHQ